MNSAPGSWLKCSRQYEVCCQYATGWVVDMCYLKWRRPLNNEYWYQCDSNFQQITSFRVVIGNVQIERMVKILSLEKKRISVSPKVTYLTFIYQARYVQHIGRKHTGDKPAGGKHVSSWKSKRNVIILLTAIKSPIPRALHSFVSLP